MTPPPIHPHAADILAEQIRLGYRHNPVGTVTGLILLPTLLAIALRDELPPQQILIALGLVYAVALLRIILNIAFARRQPAVAEMPRWGSRAAWVMGVTGVAVGVSDLMFTPDNLPYQLLVVFTIAGGGAGALVFMSAHLPAYYCFSPRFHFAAGSMARVAR